MRVCIQSIEKKRNGYKWNEKKKGFAYRALKRTTMYTSEMEKLGFACIQSFENKINGFKWN